MNDLDARIAQLSPRKRALLERMRKRDHGGDSRATPTPAGISSVDRRGPLPLSFAQERMWLLQQLEPNSCRFNLILSLRAEGEFYPDALHRALGYLLERHESLRTCFVERVDGEPLQSVNPDASVPIVSEDISMLDTHEREQARCRHQHEEMERPFDLARDALLRCRLLRYSQSEHLVIIVVHHIAFDAWSASTLFRDLGAAYKAFAAGETPRLPALPVQYVDYAVWQRQQLTDELVDQHLDYWRQRLSGLTILDLPTDRPRPAIAGHVGAVIMRELPKPLTEGLRALARQQGSTLFMTLLAGFLVVLHRYSGQDDVIVGTAISNRTEAELKPLVGLFVNTLVLRTDLSGEPSFGELLARVRETALGAYAHQELPFEQLVEEFERKRDLSRNPLFQIGFNQRDGRKSSMALPALESEQLSMRPVPAEAGTVQTDLDCHIVEGEETLLVQFSYNVELFEATTIERMLGQYERILKTVVAEPNTGVGEIELLGDGERRQLLVEWNPPRQQVKPDRTIVDLFRDWVIRQPELIAAQCGDESMSYAALDAETDRLASVLRTQGVEQGDRIGLCFQRSLGLVIGVLSIWKAGAAYLPLDPEYPDSRLRFMLEDAEVQSVLTDRITRPRLEAVCGATPTIDIDSADAMAAADNNLPQLPGPGDLAYMIYTSGSTGQPKAALLEHRGLANLSAEQVRVFNAGPGDRVLQFSSPSFDAATFDLVMALGSGATLVLADADSIRPGPPLAEVLRKHAISILTIPPSALGSLPNTDLPSLKVINMAGEACPPQLVSRWSDGRRRIFNLYGPTEATIWSTYASCVTDGSTPPIGRPVANVSCYVLDRYGQLAPVGSFGELYIGGVGIARGYWQRPELNQERFLPDPFSDDGSPMYRTGDRVRWRPDGQLEFSGRIDSQVNLRGYRIELGEIEAVVGSHPDVDETVVECLKIALGDQRLVAYLVLSREDHQSVTQVREYARARLPAYMVPSTFVVLDELPLTPNGKVDREGLPAPEGERQTEQAYEAPTSGTEQRLAAIWCEVLGIEQVGVHDNFFDLGGHSLLLTRLRARLESELGVSLPMVKLFQHPTVDAVARFLDGERAVASLHETARKRAATVVGQGQRDVTVAVVGMAGRFPRADSVEAYWEALRNGEELIRFFTDEELAAAGVPEALRSSENYVPARAVLDDVELFDAQFFGYPPREAELMDPQQRLFLESAYAALENAGIDPSRHAGLVGVYAGCSMSSYMLQLRGHPELTAKAGALQMVISNDKDFLPTRVSYKLNLNGPSVNVQTACSTSLVAVHMACRSLLEHECDVALAGGVSVSVPRVGGYTYTEQGILSPDGHCRSFDARGAGTVGGEGVGVVVLKRLEEALSDGDHIRAVIRGTAINNDGADKVGFTAPSVAHQAQVIALAQSVAGVEASSIGYVEAHGTATSLGDPIEQEALNLVFAEGDYQRGSCALGSVKSNMGHLDAAAGVAGLMKTVLMLEHGEIPPSLHYEAANPEIDFEAGPFYVNTALKPWARVDGQPWRAGVSSFGIGGTNAHAVLEEAPEIAVSDVSRRWQVLPLSAKNEAALAEACANLAAHLEQHPELPLADLSYTLGTGREQHGWRRMVVSDEVSGAIEALRDPGGAIEASAHPPVVFLYPGQGTQYPNMGRELYENEAVYREVVDECCELLLEPLGVDLRTLLYPDAGGEESAAELKRTSLTQPALFVTEYALTQLLGEWGIRPVAMVGHSIGELVAACVSGVLERDAALTLVAARGRLMEAAPSGVMLSVLASAEQARIYEGDGVWLSVVNGPSASVLSCTEEASAGLESRLESDEVGYQRLQTSHAFHCGLMDEVLDPLNEVARGLSMTRPQLPYVSNVTGDWVEADLDADYWSRQVRESVRFNAGVETVLARHPDAVLLEVGPGQALSQLVRGIAKDRAAAVVRTQAGAKEAGVAGEWLARGLGELWSAGVDVDWAQAVREERRLKVELPTYPFQRKRYWVELGKRGAEALPHGVHKQSDISKWFYAPSWKPSIVPAPLPAEARPRRWLVLAETDGLGASLADELEASDAEVIRVLPGESFERRDEAQYVIGIGVEEDYARMLDDLEARQWLPDVVLHTFGLDDAFDGIAPDPLSVGEGFFDVLHLVQALAADRPWRLELMARGVLDAPGCSPVPSRSAVAGLCRVIPQEMAGVTCRLVDAGDNDQEDGLVDDLLSELLSAPSTSEVAYRGALRWVRGYDAIAMPPPADSKSLLRHGGVYLITGGLGRIGLALGECLANEFGAKLVLTSRTPLPERASWDDPAASWRSDARVSARVDALRELEEAGAEVMTAHTDVNDEAAMRATVKAAEARFGPITGIVHAAGVMSGGGFQGLPGLDRGACNALFEPKLRGACVLESIFAGRRLDLRLLVSSLSTVLGGLGLGAYASANACLDALAAAGGKSPGLRWRCVNWDGWRGDEEEVSQGSMVARLAMSESEGVETFRRIVAMRGIARIVVSTADLDARLAQWVTVPDADDDAPPPRTYERPDLNQEYVAPLTEIEHHLAAIWGELLGVEQVGVNDSFLDLGGHSLLAIQVTARIRNELGIDVTLEEMLASPTIAELATRIENLLWASALPANGLEHVDGQRESDEI